MPSLSGAVSIYCSLTPVNLRRSFDGLPGLVRPQLGHDPPDGSLCVFLNRSLRMVKVLCREGDGLSIWSRRLGRGQFSLPRDHAGNIRLETREPQGILAGNPAAAPLPAAQLRRRIAGTFSAHIG